MGRQEFKTIILTETHMRIQVVITFWLDSLSHTDPNKPQQNYHMDPTEFLPCISTVGSLLKPASTLV